MKNIHKLLVVLGISMLLFAACPKQEEVGSGEQEATDIISLSEKHIMEENQTLPDFTSPTVPDKSVKVDGLPEDVVWLTSHPKTLGSKYAKKGGTYTTWMQSFPLTFRSVGPDANGSGRGLFWDNVKFSPVGTNSETQEFTPLLASHWAYGADKQTVYYKLWDNAAWSDGEPLTADDFVFTIDYMTSDYIRDSWYKDYYGKFEVKAINDHCVSIKYTKSVPADPRDLLDLTNFSPRPRHFYAEDGGKLPENWIEKYNWKVEPVTGPYVVTNWEKGQWIELERVRPWWGDNLPEFKQGFANIDKIHSKVVTGGLDIAKEMFYKGELDVLGAEIPQEWRDAAAHEKVVNGYIDRWVANYLPLNGMVGMFLNVRHPLFSDQKVRKAMYYAVDMQGMIDNVLFGEYQRQHNVGVGQVKYGIEFNDNTIRKPSFDPEKAKALLAEAGYDKIGDDGIAVNAEGERVAFDLIYAWKHHTERISYLVEQAKKAGVHIELVLQSGDTLWQSFTTHKFQACWTGYGGRRVPQYWEFIHSSQVKDNGLNAVFGWSSPRTDELTLANREGGLSYEDKAKNNKEIERILDDAAVFLPHYYLDYRRSLVWKHIRFPGWLNFRFNASFTNPYTYMWIDEDIRTEVNTAMQENKTFEPKIWALSERYKQK